MPAWVEYLLRILLAIALGFVMGVERRLRLKVAGIRTHVIVAAGACLFMLVSKYGFGDSGQFDASRIASQVVTGISFIGAGMIIHRQQAVHGLTSAAGIWLTAAIGMAAGAGMYLISAGATVLILAVQLILHIPCRLFNEKQVNEIRLVFKSAEEDCHSEIKSLFNVKSFNEIKSERVDGELIFNAVIRTFEFYDDEFIRNALLNHPCIISIDQSEGNRLTR